MITSLSVKYDKTKKKIRKLTVGFNKDDESKIAKRNSEKLNLNNKNIYFIPEKFLELLKKAIKYNCGPLEHPHGLAYFYYALKLKRKASTYNR